jgi:ATP-dependent Clp protease ATP-binding subunit ClpA
MSDKDKINEMIGRAFALASDNKHEYVTLEHVLFALLEDDGGKELITTLGGDVSALHLSLIHI